MSNGLALSIGLNSVDPQQFAGWSGNLNSCEKDAKDMTAILKSKGFRVTTVLTKDATYRRVTEELSLFAKSMKPGDIFVLSFSGHAGQLPDLDGDELDGNDNTWVLYDKPLTDDELYFLLEKFKKDVRILIFSQGSHGGAAVMGRCYYWNGNKKSQSKKSHSGKYRDIPSRPLDIMRMNFMRNFVTGLKDESLDKNKDELIASIIIFSACQKNQFDMDGNANGLFMEMLLKTWKTGSFQGNYRQFYRSIVSKMPREQTPRYFFAGRWDINFELEEVFSI